MVEKDWVLKSLSPTQFETINLQHRTHMSEILEPIVLIDYEKGEEAHIVTYPINTFEEILYAAKRINQDLFHGDWQLSYLAENKQSMDIGKDEILEDYLEKDIHSFYWAYKEKRRKAPGKSRGGAAGQAASERKRVRKSWRGSEGAQAANRAPGQKTQRKGAPAKVKQVKRKKYAHIGKRVIAFWIDWLLLLVLWAMLFKAGPVGMWMWWLYFAITESSKHQASFGKRIMGLKIEHNDGKRMTFMTATIRFFARIILGFGVVLAVFTKKRQTLHDLVTDTIVLDADD